MTGMRRCDSCGKLFRMENAGPEPMGPDGKFPKHFCPRCDRSQKAILEAIGSFQEDDYRFTVEAKGPPWDVYYVKKLGDRSATIAVRIVSGTAQVGSVGEGDWNEEKMRKSLLQAEPN